jgi:DNA-binding CsgD family transcriptional regulator
LVEGCKYARLPLIDGVNRLNLTDYDRVVSDIYEAALSPGHWDVALTGLVNRFSPPECDVAMLLWERLDPPAGRFIGATAVNEAARQGYLHLFAGRNPWSLAGHRLPIGQIGNTEQIVARDSFEGTSFYQDFLRHWQLDYALLVALDRHLASHLGLCVPLKAGSDHGPLQTVLGMLVPHLRRAIRISRRINEADLALASARDILDASPSPVLMCTPGLHVAYANAQASRLLDSLKRAGPGKALVPANPQSRTVLDGLARDSSCQPGAAVLLAGRAERPVAALAMRLPDRDGMASAGGEARILLVAEPPLRANPDAMRSLQSWFGLTWAESRLAVALGVGGSLEEFAASRGITVNAARFLLKGVFQKTGVNRQAALVARIRATPLDWQNAGTQVSGLPDPLDLS